MWVQTDTTYAVGRQQGRGMLDHMLETLDIIEECNFCLKKGTQLWGWTCPQKRLWPLWTVIGQLNTRCWAWWLLPEIPALTGWSRRLDMNFWPADSKSQASQPAEQDYLSLGKQKKQKTKNKPKEQPRQQNKKSPCKTKTKPNLTTQPNNPKSQTIIRTPELD